MSARTTPASSTLDSLRFARSGETLAGEYPVSALPRLLDMLASDEGMVRYRLSGFLSEGRPALRLYVDAELRMICQRCLEAYTQPVHVENVMPVARDERELTAWERDDPLIDAQVADPRLDVRNLVEDEILLSLPIMPRHADGECGSGVD
jgi:uncharacterized protein